MRFVWDEEKNRRNLAKHRVSFEIAKSIFEDPHALSIRDRIVKAEKRWQTMGLLGGRVVLMVAHTAFEDDGEEVIRIISARKATPGERNIYEDTRQKTN